MKLSSCSASSRAASPCAAERIRGPSMLFSQLLMKAGMLQETGMVLCLYSRCWLGNSPRLPSLRAGTHHRRKNKIVFVSKTRAESALLISQVRSLSVFKKDK